MPSWWRWVATARNSWAAAPTPSPASSWPLWLALVMSLAAGALALGWAPRWRDDAAMMLESARRAIHAPAPTPPPQAASVLTVLPPNSESGARLARLLETARRSGVVVRRLRESGTTPRQVQAEMGGRASYESLRTFVASALQADEALALERLRAQRASQDQTELEFDLVWTFFHREEAGESS